MWGTKFFRIFLWGPKFYLIFCKSQFPFAKYCTCIDLENLVLIRKKAAKPRIGSLFIVSKLTSLYHLQQFWRNRFCCVNQMEAKVKAWFRLPRSTALGLNWIEAEPLTTKHRPPRTFCWRLLYLRNHADHVDMDAIIVLLVQGEFF